MTTIHPSLQSSAFNGSKWTSGDMIDCGAKGPRIETHHWQCILSRQPVLGMGCCILQCLGQLSLPPPVGWITFQAAAQIGWLGLRIGGNLVRRCQHHVHYQSNIEKYWMHQVVLTSMLQFICYFIIKLLSINRRTTTTYQPISVSNICIVTQMPYKLTCDITI